MNDKISRILDIPIEITAVLGRTKMTLNEVLELGKGSLIELDTLANQEVEILVNGKKIAYGQVVIAQQNFGIKITSVLESEELVNTLK
ncbi:flagellar motor switch protein FliN [Clostridium sp.]|uniref:flagellar motor switch protein FliN n=1 Tax=Clostridium sp. TaxID=1506 RepID=UPI002624E24B|nr:flagellar motor switch protein FliN [Clostridium sp.]